MEGKDRQWRGSPLDAADTGIDPDGIEEIVFEFDNGGNTVFRPKIRKQFGSYELHMMATSLDTVASEVRRSVS